MRNKLFVSLGIACSLALAVAPVAEAKSRHKVWICPKGSHVKSHANTGTVIGAVGGGLLGNAIGGNTTGTLIGAGAGAVAGHEIGKNQRRHKACHYEYRYY